MTLFEEVQALLLHEWDPIGIVAFEGPDDEYDYYVQEILDSSMTRPGEIAQYLAESRSIRIGLGNLLIQQKEWEVAEKLAAVLEDVRSRNRKT